MTKVKLLDPRSPSPFELTHKVSSVIPCSQCLLPLSQFQTMLSLFWTVVVAPWLEPLASVSFKFYPCFILASELSY